MKNNPDIPVKKQLSDSVIQVGFCIYCGQTYQLETDGRMTESQLNEAAAMKCDCKGGTEAKKVSVKREKACKNIEDLFANSSVKDILLGCVDSLLGGVIQSVSINNGDGMTAKISITTKGNIKVERAYSRKAILED